MHPVTDKGATSVNVYFPGVNEVWYDSDTYEKFDQSGFVKVPVDLEKVQKKFKLYVIIDI